MLPLKQELEQRGLLNQYTDEALFALYDKGGQKFYFGMDPTADSLHLGNFVNFMNAVHLMRRGNVCIPLVGGATGMIGDPGGKDSERTFLDEDILQHNVDAIQSQISQILDTMRQVTGEDLKANPVFNNKTFYEGMTFLDFLRDAGKYITVNSMMSRETVKKRIEDPDKSISYTEFSYMLIQGYDFYRFFTEQDCKLQIAGSDQWGNVTIGTELIRKKTGETAYGLTCPLILDSNGKKFGKSEGNALFLDPNKTSPYIIYQYFLNVSDVDVERFLKLFTFLDFAMIDEIVAQHDQQPELRLGQKRLAKEVVQVIHGSEVAQQAQDITEFVFASDKLERLKTQHADFVQALIIQLGGVQAHDGDSIIDVVVAAGLADSRGDAKKLIQQQGISLNEAVISDLGRVIESSDWINGVLLLQKGKKNVKLVVKQ